MTIEERALVLVGKAAVCAEMRNWKLLEAELVKAMRELVDESAQIAEHLNGWGNPPAPKLAAHIAKVIRADR